MKIHEYQAKNLLKKYGVAVPKGNVAFTSEEAYKVAQGLNKFPLVVKAQIHAGGRGKGGGIQLAQSSEEVEVLAKKLLGMKLITHQTGPDGKIVQRILIEEGVDISRELYLGIVLDRSRSQFVIMASTEGGVEIEEVAGKSPEKIIKVYIDPFLGLLDYQVRELGFRLGLEKKSHQRAVHFIKALYKAFEGLDCSLAEINPLVITRENDVLALDAKINFDDNALYRHPEFEELRDTNEEEPLETEASKYNLNYIKLDGAVGCMVNGAGLAMATMDLIKLAGSMPANFLDVGGVANVDTIKNGFNILLSDSNVRAVLINIFGGIVRCDRVAKGVVEAASQLDIKVPVVVRLEGTNRDEGVRILKESSLKFSIATGLQEAAAKIVDALKE